MPKYKKKVKEITDDDIQVIEGVGQEIFDQDIKNNPEPETEKKNSEVEKPKIEEIKEDSEENVEIEEKEPFFIRVQHFFDRLKIAFRYLKYKELIEVKEVEKEIIQTKIVNTMSDIDLSKYFVIIRELNDDWYFAKEDKFFNKIIFLSPTESLENSLYIDTSEDVDIDDTLLIEGIEARHTQLIYLGLYKNLPPIFVIAYSPVFAKGFLNAVINVQNLSGVIDTCYEQMIIWSLRKIKELENDLLEKDLTIVESETNLEKWKQKYEKIKNRTQDKALEIPSNQMIVSKATFYVLITISCILSVLIMVKGFLSGGF